MSTALASKLSRLKPAAVVAYLDDGTTKRLVPAKGHKAWNPILAALRVLAWERVELVNAAGDLVDLVANENATPPSDDARERASTMRDLVAAQREALTWQDKSVRTALDTCVAVMRELGSSLSSSVVQLTKLHQMQMEAATALVGPVVDDVAPGTGDGLRSNAILEKLLPMVAPMIAAAIARSMQGEAPASKPVIDVDDKPKKNGANGAH